VGLIIVFGVIFLVTALLTAAEMATFSARPERMRQVAESGDRRGRLVLAYQRSPVSFLAAGQVIATAAALGIGAIMQARIVPWLSAWMGGFLALERRQLDATSSTVALIGFTILALILTNVVPKQIGFDHADDVAVFFARPFRLLIKLTRPIAWIVTVTSQVFEKAVNRRVVRGSRVTESDLLTLVAEGIRIGALDERETGFVKRALRLSDWQVTHVMTPIDRIEGVDANWDPQRVDRAVRESRHSYLPVYSGSMDRPIGVLRARDWLSSQALPASVRPLLGPLGSIESSKSALGVFDVLKGIDARMVVVVQDGRSIGIVAVNDAVALLAEDVRSLHD
jgi:putative hemolysin